MYQGDQCMDQIKLPIYFIGMPLSGKTTIAKLVAKELNIPWIDLDSEIEKKAHLFIDDIFNQYGEPYFRKLETETLLNFKEHHAIISCGGGIVLNKSHKDIMNLGHVIHIMSDLDILKKRQQSSYDRPILLKKTLDQLMDERFLKYQEFAHIHIQNDVSIEETVQTVITYIKENLT